MNDVTQLPVEWRPVVGYEGTYEVSDRGDVRRVGKTKALRGSPLTYAGKYLGVKLSKSGIAKTVYVHVLVAEAFHGLRPEGLVCRHLNDEGFDNRIENLAWGTPRQNVDDMHRNGKYVNVRSRQTHCIRGHWLGGVAVDDPSAVAFGVSVASTCSVAVVAGHTFGAVVVGV